MSTLRNTLKEAFWILLIAFILAAGAYALRPAIKASNGRDPSSEVNQTAAGVATIDFDAAVEHFNAGTALFADARSEADYLSGHIEGALHLDPHHFDRWSEQVFAQIDADAVIITYCDGKNCTLSEDLAEKLTWLGYDNVRHLDNGWSRWTDAHMPIRAGAAP